MIVKVNKPKYNFQVDSTKPLVIDKPPKKPIYEVVKDKKE